MPIHDLIHQIRDTVNEAVFIHNIRRHGFLWNMVCASMDTIEDTQLATEAYQNSRKGENGHRYLEIYGLFQAMFLQQDAVVKLAEGLNLTKVDIWKDADSKYVRDIRNKYFGHPTKKQVHKTQQVTYHGIARMSVGAGALEGWTYPNFKTETINIKQTLKRHENATEKILASIQAELQTKGKTYMGKFTLDLPTSSHEYEFQKLYMWALGSRTDGIMAKASAEILSKELDTIQAGMAARYEDAEHVGDIMREITKAKYCLKVLQEGLASSRTDSKSIFIFEAHIDSLKQTFEGIIAICSEVNAEFKKRPYR